MSAAALWRTQVVAGVGRSLKVMELAIKTKVIPVCVGGKVRGQMGFECVGV